MTWRWHNSDDICREHFMGTFHQERLATGHKVSPVLVLGPCAGKHGLLRALSSGMVTVPCWTWPQGESPPMPVMDSMDQVPQSPLKLCALGPKIPSFLVSFAYNALPSS